MKRIGSRSQVFKGFAKQTSGGLTKKDLFRNKQGRYVSLKKHKQSKNPDLNPLLKKKLLQKKGSGEFGPKDLENNKSKKNNKKSQKKKKCFKIKDLFTGLF